MRSKKLNTHLRAVNLFVNACCTLETTMFPESFLVLLANSHDACCLYLLSKWTRCLLSVFAGELDTMSAVCICLRTGHDVCCLYLLANWTRCLLSVAASELDTMSAACICWRTGHDVCPKNGLFCWRVLISKKYNVLNFFFLDRP